MSPTSPFTPNTLRFLRALKRNNRREWFHAHKDRYEHDVRQPMIAAVERLADELRGFAPDLMADPRRSLFRIWRDTRFSEDRRPLKTEIGAVFPHRNGRRHESAALYFEIGPQWVFAGGGLYRPERTTLQRVRERIAMAPDRFHRLVTAPAVRREGGLQGEQLKRVPRGFPADHPTAAYLKHTELLVFREWAPELMTSPRFWPEILRVFKATAPLVRFLNEAILEQGAATYSTRTMRSTT